jgi:hypothetical protein
MLSISKELNNIPISISILHDQEYNNLCCAYKFSINGGSKRRAFSERNEEKPCSSDDSQVASPRSPQSPVEVHTIKKHSRSYYKLIK